MTALVVDTRAPGVYQIDEDDWEVVPYHLGPTWELDPHWEGPRDPDGYILPELTLGWQVIYWIEHNLLADETGEHDQPLPFRCTNEQLRFLLWFYAIDEDGRFLYREVILQRLKGHGKDPLAAVISAVEFVGPCRFAGWCTEDMPEHGLEAGDPFAKPHPRAWVQIAAVSLAQTQNTMKLFHSLFSPACKSEHSIDIGKETIYAYHGQKTIQAVTSSPRALEGNRPTLIILNETHHWLSNNDGIAMADAIERNATKAKDGAARQLSITNAFEPSEDSVASQQREAYELAESGMAAKTGVMYDTLEAPEDARLRPPMPDTLPAEEQERRTRKYLARILEAVRGDAVWLDIPTITNSILSPRNKPSRSRRFFFNQVAAAEDAWADPLAVERAISRMAIENRAMSSSDSRSLLEAGWLVAPTEPVVMFFDGSKSDDATVLVGCRLSDGYIFTIGVWQKPAQRERAKTWLAPREAVDERVKEAFDRFNIVAFWGDPSHAKDDQDGSRYWDGLMDKWMRQYADRLDPAYWPTKSGHNAHAIMFDMTGTERLKLFVAAAEEFIEALETLNDIEECAPQFQIDGHPAMLQHLKNARRHVGAWGVSLMKDNRESSKKIDLAVGAVGARMLARVVLNKGLEDEPEPDRTVWGLDF